MALRQVCSSLRSGWDALQRLIDTCVQVAGPTYVVLASLLISSVIYIFFTVILPVIYRGQRLEGIAHALVACWLVLNVFYNYLNCVYTDPGSPPTRENFCPSSSSRWCKHCRKQKPPFTHHCHICKRCILRMDHHCPWMNNCIGFYNYRFFFVFLFYLWLGCGYGSYVSSRLLFAENYEEHELQVMFSFVLSVAIFGALCCLLGWHIFLILTAQTTIDFYVNRQRIRDARSKGEVWTNEYDMGKYENVRRVFSCSGVQRYWWLVLLLPCGLKPSGDGISFGTRPFRGMHRLEV